MCVYGDRRPRERKRDCAYRVFKLVSHRVDYWFCLSIRIYQCNIVNLNLKLIEYGRTDIKCVYSICVKKFRKLLGRKCIHRATVVFRVT